LPAAEASFGYLPGAPVVIEGFLVHKVKPEGELDKLHPGDSGPSVQEELGHV